MQFFKILFALVCVLLLSTSLVWAQTGTIQGTVTDENGKALPGTNVQLVGTQFGAATQNDGSYTIKDVPAGEYMLKATYIGFQEMTASVTITGDAVTTLALTLQEGSVFGETLVVTASKRQQKITEAPATIDVISARQIDEHPSSNLGELLAYEKGVDYIRTGVLGTGLNIRGFNSAFNSKNLQMNDNRLSTLIATGLPLGALGTTVKEDVERIEIILGPNAALYGPNAHNGLINTITKDPRTSEGTTFAGGGGSHSTFSGRVRHAKVVNETFRYKVSGEYTQGEEFNFVDSVYVGGAAFNELLLDRDFDSIRGEASFYFSPNPESDFIITAGASNSNNIGVTNAGRNMIKDWRVFFGQAQYVSPRFFAQVYHSWSITDDTFAMNQRTQNYLSFINAGFSEQESVERSLHEQWNATFGIPLNRESNFQDDSRRVNAEAQYNNTWEGFEVTGGVQYQKDMADSKGTFLIDNGGSIDLDQVGVYTQVEKALGESGFRAIAAARVDDHEFYGSNFIPKGGLLYTQGSGTWRLTYGKGIAAPTILNLSANIFGGLLLGNGEGFTLADGSAIPKLEVETIQTVEAGYKGIVSDKLFIDSNAYINFHEEFISPLINIAGTSPVTQRGGRPISDVLPGQDQAAFLLTYLNFGQVTTYGFDFGLNYFVNKNVSVKANYSFFDFDLDSDDPKNDGNRDGQVLETDLPINAPKHKLNVALTANRDEWFGMLGARWVDEYDFFSGINVAAATNTDLIVGGDPVVEGQRVGRDFNEGPLGGYVNFDVSVGYRATRNLAVSAQVINIFDSEVRDFVASPSIGRLFAAELKYTIY